jgi:predicted pyridoxine 5'-phosphate oxidase superfamily flavin-nucleotide-binding protein
MATVSGVSGYSSDVAFTPRVKDVQTRRGSRAAYARMEKAGSWETRITPELEEFIAAQTSVFLATANREGQPYIQHRGGPPGFLKVLDGKTLAFADFVGNRQYITTGNLEENPLAQLFLIDYAHRRRVKIWGRAQVVEDDAPLALRLMPAGYKARVEQAIIFTVSAWDRNCPQHIPRRVEAAEVAGKISELEAVVAERDARIVELLSTIARLENPGFPRQAAP